MGLAGRGSRLGYRPGVVALTQRDAPETAAPFKSNDELLDAAVQMIAARQAAAGRGGKPAGKVPAALLKRDASWTTYWHAALELTGDEVSLRAVCRRHELKKIECELLMAFILERLGFLHLGGVVRDVPASVGFRGAQVFDALRALSEQGKLVRSGLVEYENLGDDFGESTVIVDSELVESVIRRPGEPETEDPVQSEDVLHKKLAVLTSLLETKALCTDSREAVKPWRLGRKWVVRMQRKVDQALSTLNKALDAHPEWGTTKLLRPEPPFEDAEVRILLALLGRALEHLDEDSVLFTGRGLARAASAGRHQDDEALELLEPNGRLTTEGLVEPVAGDDEFLSDRPETLAGTVFALSQKAIDILGLKRLVPRLRSEVGEMRAAAVKMEQLVLSEGVREALSMAVAQARNSKVLVEDWGLGRVLPYGRGVVLLFSGPPGVGKTACAEALAGELGRPILVADYSRIQNCYVGNTEKNIARAFRQARAQGAVLFWDEADAMCYDREQAQRPWEVRDVSVILQEVERFDGVCILATNRRLSLDPALERRISLKLAFDPPDRTMRRDIWSRLLPPTMPLAADVDLDELAEAELTGGEIKNAVLNAARSALARGGPGPVTMADFRKAVAMEITGRWSRETTGRIGFGAG